MQAAPESVAMDFNMPLAGLQVWHYKDPAKAVEAQIKVFEAMKPGGSFQTAMLKDKPELKTNAQTHRGFKLNAVSLQWDFDKIAESNPAGKQMVEVMKKMMGEGMKSWFGTDGKVYVQVAAKDWESARSHLDQFLDGKNAIGQEKAFQEARKQLPAEATILGVIDAPVYGQMITEIMQVALKGQGIPFPIPTLKAEKGKSYFGMAVTLRPQHGSMDFWLPASAVQEFRKMVEAGKAAGDLK
jgi:hypothetical protein